MTRSVRRRRAPTGGSELIAHRRRRGGPGRLGGRRALAALGALDDGPRRCVDASVNRKSTRPAAKRADLCSGWFAASPNSFAITAASV